jgi:hypothetical protein
MNNCNFCYKEEELYSYAIPLTTDTVFLCKECIEDELGITVEESGKNPVPVEK